MLTGRRNSMSFTMLLLSPDADPSWPANTRQAVPGALAKICADPKDTLADIESTHAVFGAAPPEQFARRRSSAGSALTAPAWAVPTSMMGW
jgi:hypothetical protein